MPTGAAQRQWRMTLVISPEADGDVIRKLAPFTKGHVPVDGKAAAYVCRDFACQMPTTDPKKLAELLDVAAETSSD